MTSVMSPTPPPSGGIFMSTLQKKKRSNLGSSANTPGYTSKSLDNLPPPSPSYTDNPNPKAAAAPTKQNSLDSSLDANIPPATTGTLSRTNGVHQLDKVPESTIPDPGPTSPLRGPDSPTSPLSTAGGPTSPLSAAGASIFQSTLQRKQKKVAKQHSESHTQATSPAPGSTATFARFQMKSSNSTASLPGYNRGAGRLGSHGGDSPSSPGSSILSPASSCDGSASIFMSTLQRRAQGKCQGPTCMMTRSVSTLPRQNPPPETPPSSFMEPLLPKAPASLFPDSDLDESDDDRVAKKPWAVPDDSDEEVGAKKKYSSIRKHGVSSKSWDVPSDSDGETTPKGPMKSRQSNKQKVRANQIPPAPAQKAPVTPSTQSHVLSRPPVQTVPAIPSPKLGRLPPAPASTAPAPLDETDLPPPPPQHMLQQSDRNGNDSLPPPPKTPPPPITITTSHGQLAKANLSQTFSNTSEDSCPPPIPPKDIGELSPLPTRNKWNVPDNSDSDDDEPPTWGRRHSEDSGMLESSGPNGASSGALAAGIGSSTGGPEPITMYYNSIRKAKQGGSLIGSDMDMTSPTDHSSGFDSKSSIVSDDDSSYVPSVAEYEQSPDTIDVNDIGNSLPRTGDRNKQAKRVIVTEETREFVPEESTGDQLVERIVQTQTITEQMAPGNTPVLYKDYGGEDFAKYLEDDDEFVKFIHNNGRSEEKKKGRKKTDEPLFIDPFKGMEPQKPVKLTTPVEKQTVKQTITTLIRKKKGPASKLTSQAFHGSESTLNLAGKPTAPIKRPSHDVLNNFTYTDSKIGAASALSSSDEDPIVGHLGVSSPTATKDKTYCPTSKVCSTGTKARSFWNLEQLGCKQSEMNGEVTLGRLRKGKSLDDEGFERSHKKKPSHSTSSPDPDFDEPLNNNGDDAAMLFAAASRTAGPLKITTMDRQKLPKAAKGTGSKSKGFKGFKFWKKNQEKVKVNPLPQALGSSEEGDYQEFVPGQM